MKNIICINDEKYKSIYINFNILLDIKDYDVTSIAVITSMLSKATKKYQNQTEIKKYLMSLYGTNFEAGVKKIGDVYVIEFKVEFLNKLYTIDNEDLFDKVLDFIHEVIYDPYLVNGSFSKDIMEIEKNFISQKIKSLKDDNTSYAIYRAEKMLNRDKVSGMYIFGNEKDLEKVNVDDLYYRYKNIILNSKLQVVVSGNLNGYEKIEEKINNKFFKNDRKDICYNFNLGTDESFEEVVENTDSCQSIMTYGLSLNSIKKDDAYVGILYNAILGGSPSSKLFQEFREKESLAYTVRSRFYRTKKQLIIFAGINSVNFEKAKNVLNRELEKMKNGDIEKYEIDAAKDSLISNYVQMQDSKVSMSQFAFINDLEKNDITIDDAIKIIENITKDDIVDFANRLVLRKIFLLKGE